MRNEGKQVRIKSWRSIQVVLVSIAFVIAVGLTAFNSVYTETTIVLGEGSICLSYSSEEHSLTVVYSIRGSGHRLTLSSTERMTLLIQVHGKEVSYSLWSAEEGERPCPARLEAGVQILKTVLETPDWVVIVVQAAEEREAG